MSETYDYDLCVIGSGPAGQKCAVQAAKLGKRVCIIERKEVVGGVAINTGTIPSKALREAILHLTGFGERSIFGASYQVKKDITIQDLSSWCQHIIRNEVDVVAAQLTRNDVEIIHGEGAIDGPHRVRISHGSRDTEITAQFIYIATGTRPARPDNVAFDQEHLVDADGMLTMPRLPRTMIVVGGGVIGTEYASMMQALGVKVTLVEGRDGLLDFLDPEIQEALQYHLRQHGMTLRMGEKVVKIEMIDAPPNARSSTGKLVEAMLESGKTLRAESLLYAIGRQGATRALNLASVGIEADRRGRVRVNNRFQVLAPANAGLTVGAGGPTHGAVPDADAPAADGHIYAGGDVIGFPALASTAMEQGRLAACHMFGIGCQSFPEHFPFGIYAVPEISMVGWTEQQLTEQDVPFESGVARYREIARGQLLGDEDGMLKLLVHPDTRLILGVHCIGNGATELIHIGQAVMLLKGTIDYFISTVFNYPTLAECYKVAALNAVNKLAHM
ncbi:MAG: NAD(P)(+) transhydrogenase (Si-specific) [Phycisphaerales bacterium]|nr:NAD(P)(+) transhydrogenase (Si-specific) [Phycisphaerales bacterium]